MNCRTAFRPVRVEWQAAVFKWAYFIGFCSRDACYHPVENPSDPAIPVHPAFLLPVTPQPALRDCVTGRVGVSGRAHNGGLGFRVFLLKTSCPFKTLATPQGWHPDMPSNPCICTLPSKLHPCSCELLACSLPSLPCHSCFSLTCVWKNSSVFLLTITFLWTVFLVVISTAPQPNYNMLF